MYYCEVYTLCELLNFVTIVLILLLCRYYDDITISKGKSITSQISITQDHETL